MTNQTPRKRRTRRPSLTKLLKAHGSSNLEQYCAEHDVATRTELANKAQQIILSSHECADDLDQIQMCLQALEIYPLAADALTIIATIGDYSVEEAQILLEMSVEAAKLDCVEYLANDVGFFWGILETRPYMRAHFNLAQVLLDLDKVDEAIDIYRHLLALDDNDSLGVRFELLPLLQQLGLKAEIQVLSDRYEIEWDEGDKESITKADSAQTIQSLDDSNNEEWHILDNVGVWSTEELEAYAAIEVTLQKHSDKKTGILSISGLDGLFTALVSSPTILPGQQWMPLLFSDGSIEPMWDSPEEFMLFFEKMSTVLNKVANTFHNNPSDFRPLLCQKPQFKNPTAQSVQDWCSGYLKIANQWDPDNHNKDLSEALSEARKHADPKNFLKLSHMNRDEQEQVYTMLSAASIAVYWHFEPQQIAEIEKIAQSKMAMRNEAIAGRNDLCPCGSGKKYKKCCLQ